MINMHIFLCLLTVLLCAVVIAGCGPGGEETARRDEEHPEEGPVPEPAQEYLTVDLGEGVELELRLIPAGRFVMGASPGDNDTLVGETPHHRVAITKAFYIGVYEVTQEQWRRVMGSTLRRQRDEQNHGLPIVGEGPEYPMYYVSWEEAAEFCSRLSRMVGDSYRLPTEAEWEYACRAGTETRFYWGDDEGEAEDFAWYADNSGSRIHPVGRKRPNPWGLHDMSGNVWEWCSDCYDDYYYSRSPTGDPRGASRGAERALRGGCWFFSARFIRSSFRSGTPVYARSNLYGFRVVREVR